MNKSKLTGLVLVAAFGATACSEPLLRSGDPEARRRAVIAAGQARDRTALTTLVELLANDTHEGVREEAACALGRLGDRRAVAPLVAKGASGDRLTVRHTAVQALGALQDPTAVPGLIALARNSEGADDGGLRYDLRYEIVEALTAIGPAAVHPLLDALADAAPGARRVAVEVIGHIGDRGAKERAAALRTDPDVVVRQAAERVHKAAGLE